MKAITTRFLGWTNRLPARVVATDLDGNRATVPADGSLDEDFLDTAHRKAAVALCDKMGWDGADTLIEGAIKNGRVFVFAPTPAPQPARTWEYAKVAWTTADVLDIRPKWSEAQAKAALERNEDYLQERLTELGWDVLETLIGMDETTEPTV